ncbi:acetylornithine deacetylase [Marinihelvus fidelis]|uniref:acetylornithine deacetylase n=1 Tax=Marinihelvus fidelis TaxID=2613842 RepID=UPI0017862DA2|nr:acetylornithine deacetylase [Marinihelvus fidelis]
MSTKVTIERVLAHLEALVAFDTQNPPRDFDAQSPMFAYLAESLGEAFSVDVTDHGKGRVTFHARRGMPKVLFNVHLDTVPVLDGAARPPLELIVEDGRAYGRGACDIKGAAACLLALAETTDAPMALLFTTDEEGAEGCCVAEFLASGAAAAYSQVVVAEPTECVAQFRHRGYLSARGRFVGVGGHSSEPRALDDNAIHRLVRWSASAIELARSMAAERRRSCFNIGTAGGGVKSNVIADHADIFWSARLAPGDSNDDFLATLSELDGGEHAEWITSFSGPPLPTAGHDDAAARQFAALNELPTGDGLDFWTEASLFAAAGLPALVLGPGNIEQAHVVDEWVALEQLERACERYGAVVNGDV